MDLWKGCDNIILWGVERALAYNLLDVLQHQNVYALVPSNELKHALKKKLEEQDFDAALNIEQAYLNDKEGEATLREFSLPQMNSLRAPSGIFDIYPGLKQLQMQSVKCLSPNSLLAAYELPDQVKNTLWLEVNGQITSTIQELIESQKIYLMTSILVFMPKQAWYESEVDAEALIQRLKQVGYDVSNKNVDLDSDQDLYEFTRHPLVLEKKLLESEVKGLKTDTVEYQKQLEASAQQVAELITQNKESQNKQAELVESHKNKDEQIAQLIQDRDESIAQQQALETKQAEQVESHKNKDQQIAQLSQERDEQSHWHQENKKWAESLKQELAASTQQKNTIEQQLAQLQVKQNELVESHKNKDANITALTQEKGELIFRQTILDTEIVKVEAQLELVKDVVLREKTF